MANREIPSASTSDLRVQIDDLAKRALSGVRQKLQPGQQKKIRETAHWLTRYSVSLNFDLDSALDALDQKSIPAEVLIDYCIPLAAEELGNDWADDLKGFGQVTLATSRLQMILNNLITYRNSDAEIISRHGLMLIICKDEQHTLGPSILADQLRRRGQSVKILHSTDSKEIVNLCHDHDFSAVLFSCAGHHSLDYIDKSVKSIKQQGKQRPLIFVGGKILDLEPAIRDKVSADAFTNDIELVIAKVEQHKSDKMSVELTSRASR
jgi:methylmalonyl-CoA mutase cobalamin-binding subunit